MHNSIGTYVVGMEVMTPTGMNLAIASHVAHADLARFEQKTGSDGIERFTFATIEYTEADELFPKTCEFIANLLDSLLDQLPSMLKPIPLLIAVPSSLSLMKIKEWLSQGSYAAYLSTVEVVHATGPSLMLQATQWLQRFDAMICISIDSMVSAMPALMDSNMVMSTQNPWGIIPSEGGAGLILCRKNAVDTLQLKPVVQLGYLDFELNTVDSRGMFRLVQRAAKKLDAFGEVYSDMTNLRAHTEDYGFALGAKASRFTNPEQPHRINDLWGSMGNCSSLALVAYAAQYNESNQPISLLSFNIEGDKALIQLLPC